MLKKRILKMVLCGLLTVMMVSQWLYHITVSSQNVLSHQNASYILIDAGHGGPDGGASDNEGTAEDDLNLLISLNLQDMLSFLGYDVKMTRITDTAVTDTGDESYRSWKVEDMYSRLKMYDAALFTVSIHQNHFSQSQYNGSQTFYSLNCPESKDIASVLQQQIVAFLQPDNRRAIKPAGENIFLLHNTKRPAVIVECGFLSNQAEAQKLKTKLYQQQMAFAVCCGILKYAP